MDGDGGFKAFLVACSFLVVNASVAFFGSILTLTIITVATGVPLFDISGQETDFSLHKQAASATGNYAEAISIAAVFVMAVAVNWLFCSFLVPKQGMEKWAVVISVFPALVSGLAGALFLANILQ